MSDSIQIIHDGQVVNLPNDSQGAIAVRIFGDLRKRTEQLEKELLEAKTQLDSSQNTVKDLGDRVANLDGLDKETTKSLMEAMGCSPEELKDMDFGDIKTCADYLKKKMMGKMKNDWLDKEVTERVTTYWELLPMVADGDRGAYSFDPSKEPHELRRDFLVYKDPDAKSYLCADGVTPEQIDGYYKAFMRHTQDQKIAIKTEEQRSLLSVMPKNVVPDGRGGMMDATDPAALAEAARQKRIQRIEQGGK